MSEKNFLNVNIPFFWGWLDEGFLYDSSPNPASPRIPMEFFLYTSIPGRCGLFTGLSEWGTQHARIPTHYIYTKPEGESVLDAPLDWLQLWDSFSYYCSALQVDYLKNKAVEVMLKNRCIVHGRYMFTLDWANGGYAEMAAGHKTGHVLDCAGRLLIQPNNRIMRWCDAGAFTIGRLPKMPHWKVFSQEFSCEAVGNKWVAKDDEEVYWYDFEEVDEKQGGNGNGDGDASAEEWLREQGGGGAMVNTQGGEGEGEYETED